MNQNLYQSNLNFLLSNQRIACRDEKFLEIFREPDPSWRNRLPSVLQNGFEKNGIRFHSARDPQREAQKQLDHVLGTDKRHIIFLGTGLGYILAEALKNPNIESLLVFETDPEILYYCLNITSIFKTSKDIYFYLTPEPELDPLENILPFFQNKNLDKICVYNHRPSFQEPGSKFPLLEKQLGAIMHKRAINQATIIKFQGIWNKNIALNIKSILHGKTLNMLVEKLRGKFRNIVICGAGPSLELSYPEIRKFRNRFFLICADTAFIPLMKNKITPDLVISADPQWLNHFFALSPEAAECDWLMDPVVCYQSTHYLDRLNASIYWWDNPFHLDQIIRDFKSRGEIAHGGSVSTNAFDLARKLEPESIIMVGQDLSFSQKTAHVRGAVLESMVFFKNNRFHGFEMHNLKQMKSLPPRKVARCIDSKDILFTNDKMKVFIEWFENQLVMINNSSRINFYNATCRGVLLGGFIHRPLGEILENCQPENFPEKPENSKSQVESGTNSVSQIKKKLEKLQTDCSQAENLYRNNMNLTRKIQSFSANGNSSRDIYVQLDRNDAQIKKLVEINQIISINAQHAILKITELGDESANTGFLLYKSMYLSARKLNYYFKKILATLGKSSSG